MHFNTKVTDLLLQNGEVNGVVLQNGEKIKGESVILATGHSARDIYELLNRKKILIEAKPFALGVRVEHQQNLIDKIQYHCETDRGLHLPASSYALVHQANVNGKERGCFRFVCAPVDLLSPQLPHQRSSSQWNESFAQGFAVCQFRYCGGCGVT